MLKKRLKTLCSVLVLIVVTGGLTGSLADTFTQDKAPESSNQDPEKSVEKVENEDAKTEEGAWKRFNDRIDGYFKKINDGIKLVLFYEVFGKEEKTVETDGAATNLEDVRKLLDKLKETGIDTVETDLTLTLPYGTFKNLSKKERKDKLKKMVIDFRKEFNKGSRAFTIAINTKDKSKNVTTLKGKRNGVPAAVLWLVLGSIFFTFRMGFINFRGFRHAVMVTAGKYDNPDDEGEVSHFQALSAALSATVGLGNIAGVAVAISIGGPGATVWMIVAGFLGMSSKFTECMLGQKFREVRPDGQVMGGAMFYLSRGLKQVGLGPLGFVLAIVFAILCVGGSLAGGNAFQVNQSLGALKVAIPDLKGYEWIYGLIMTGLVGVVIIGGIKRIASTAEKIVPAMCGIYVLAGMAIILKNYDKIGDAIQTILESALTPAAGYGAFFGVLALGFQRAAFSNEAGVGSAAIAHSAAKTEYPVREGIVALLEPFIDTIVICTMTALVIVITGAYQNPEYASHIFGDEGAALTSKAMDAEIPNFKYLLSVAVILFAFSTMISWSYYGERCWVYLFGDQSSLSYKILFLIFVFLGSIVSAKQVLGFGDIMILAMAVPNILGVIFLTNMVKRDLDDYWAKYKSGEIKPFQKKS